MCGRFNFSNHSKVKGTKELGVTRSFNIAPSSAIAVLNEDMKCLKLNWGFTPSWMKQDKLLMLRGKQSEPSQPSKDLESVMSLLMDGMSGLRLMRARNLTISIVNRIQCT